MRPKDAATTMIEVGSSVSVTIGACMLASWLGWVVGGVLGLLFAWRLAE
jgi:hypothetical protein